jgi:hypothetical protein
LVRADRQTVWIQPLADWGWWQVDCSCHFSHADTDYRTVYEVAELHLADHEGPKPRPDGRKVVGALGGWPAVHPDVDPVTLEAARSLWIDWLARMEDRPYEDRFDGEYFGEFLEDRPGAAALRAANRATMVALKLERVTAEPGWREHVLDVAQQLIAVADQPDPDLSTL